MDSINGFGVRFQTQQTTRAGVLAIIGNKLAAVVERVLAWQDRASQRRQLDGLNDIALKDIGLSRADVEREAGKPFWRI